MRRFIVATAFVLNTATYHYRVVAHNSDGMATGETGDKTFTTLANPPSVVVNAAGATAEGFNLSGTVNPHGADAEYRFEYGTTTSYGTNIPVPDGDAGSGSTAAPVSPGSQEQRPPLQHDLPLPARRA